MYTSATGLATLGEAAAVIHPVTQLPTRVPMSTVQAVAAALHTSNQTRTSRKRTHLDAQTTATAAALVACMVAPTLPNATNAMPPPLQQQTQEPEAKQQQQQQQAEEQNPVPLHHPAADAAATEDLPADHESRTPDNPVQPLPQVASPTAVFSGPTVTHDELLFHALAHLGSNADSRAKHLENIKSQTEFWERSSCVISQVSCYSFTGDALRSYSIAVRDGKHTIGPSGQKRHNSVRNEVLAFLDSSPGQRLVAALNAEVRRLRLQDTTVAGARQGLRWLRACTVLACGYLLSPKLPRKHLSCGCR